MNFVDNDILEVFKEFDPFGMVRQDPGVQHVRIGHHDVPRLTHGAPGSGRRIPVIGIRLDIDMHGLNQFIQLGNLIRRKGFCREKIQGSRIRILHDFPEDRQVITHGLARGRRGNHTDILPFAGQVNGLPLMAVQLIDSPVSKHLNQPGVRSVRKRRIFRLFRGNGLPVGHIPHKLRICPERSNQLIQIHSENPSECSAISF